MMLLEKVVVVVGGSRRKGGKTRKRESKRESKTAVKTKKKKKEDNRNCSERPVQSANRITESSQLTLRTSFTLIGQIFQAFLERKTRLKVFNN